MVADHVPFGGNMYKTICFLFILMFPIHKNNFAKMHFVLCVYLACYCSCDRNVAFLILAKLRAPQDDVRNGGTKKCPDV